MILDRVTISGADDETDHQNMAYLQERFPFVEWGILLSPTRAGSSRYPSKEWIEALPGYEINTAAHFCGDYARAIMERGDHGKITEVKKYFDRLQMNYSFKNKPDISLAPFFDFATALWDTDLILAYNKGNKETIDEMILHNQVPDNIHFLYDSSGGRGTLIEDIQPPLPTYTGYAGGIGPDNIQEMCSMLENFKVIKSFDYADRHVWIDMETGVRTGETLDLKKVEYVLDICSLYIK